MTRGVPPLPFLPRRRMACFVWIIWLYVVRTDAFVPIIVRSQQASRLWEQPPTVTTKESPKKTFNASESIGSLLMQLQKTEEVLRLQQQEDSVAGANRTTVLWQDPAAELDSNLNASQFHLAPPPKQTELTKMDVAAARELDEAVFPAPREVLLRDVARVLPMPSLYTAEAAIPNTTTTDLPLSKPEHYQDRIGRDMRELAVSVASSVEDVSQWSLFCQESGGLIPLLECIREGARWTNEWSASLNQEEQFSAFHHQYEETFAVACSACRALRDLCAISPEVSAVLTDGILRTNQAWTDTKDGTNLLSDFVVMLRHAHEFSEPMDPRQLYRRRRRRRRRKDTQLRCKLYVTQLLLAMTEASDEAVQAVRDTPGLKEAVLASSSHALQAKTKRWLRYPGELVKWLWRSRKGESNRNVSRPFIEAVSVGSGIKGQVLAASNQLLAAIGYNKWVPKIPGQKGLRILCMDGGGSRGITAVTAVDRLVELTGMEIADSFDIVAGTSTGGIIAFLVGLRRETSKQAVDRYNELIKQIFVKSALSTPMMIFTTATYDASPFMKILSRILGDDTMLDSRSDPRTPLVFAVTSKMSSTPTHIALCRNYNYAGGELKDPFTVDVEEARIDLGLPFELEDEMIQSSTFKPKNTSTGGAEKESKVYASRHPGSFRVLQRYALRASTAAPTVFKPVLMGGEMYCDGGIVASNPAAVAIHEARALFPGVPIELVLSIGTGAFVEQKSPPKIGWDGIIGQIVASATDGEQIHHILEDVLGEGGTAELGKSSVSKTRYFRLNPTLGLPDDFPIDVTDPGKLAKLTQITNSYLDEPEQQAKLREIADILRGDVSWKKWLSK